jgi:hypothetical protein
VSKVDMARHAPIVSDPFSISHWAVGCASSPSAAPPPAAQTANTSASAREWRRLAALRRPAGKRQMRFFVVGPFTFTGAR